MNTEIEKMDGAVIFWVSEKNLKTLLNKLPPQCRFGWSSIWEKYNAPNVNVSFNSNHYFADKAFKK